MLAYYYSNWLSEDKHAAIDWYLLNKEKIPQKTLLNERTLYQIQPELFLSIFEALLPDEKHWFAVATVADFELEVAGSSESFVTLIKDTTAFDWGRVTADAISGKIQPAILLDKTANSFASMTKPDRRDGIPRPWAVYRAIEYVSWNSIPKEVKEWLDTTPYLHDVVRADIRAMLASRQ